MALRAEQVNNSKQKRSNSAQSDDRASSQRHIMTPDSDSKLEGRQTLTPEPPKQNQQQEKKQETSSKKPMQPERKEATIEEVKQMERNQNGIEERQEPEGRQADRTVTEQDRKEVQYACSLLY